MKCETLQFNLPLFSDDELSADERLELREHLASCPVCRAKHAEFLSLKNDLRGLSRLEIPADLVMSVRNSVRIESKQFQRKPDSFFSETTWEWMQMRLMPYSVGTVFSLLLTVSLLYTLVVTKQASQKISEDIAANNARMVTMPGSNRISRADDEIILTKEEIAALRVPVSMESPSLNPKGALIALTRSLARGNMKDDEVTVVADVLSTGLAQIAQVVEAPRNRESMNELTDALENDGDDKPFVPANIDNRSKDMRVVFKVIWVDVDNKSLTDKKSSKK